MTNQSLHRRFVFLFTTLLATSAAGIAQDLPTPQQLVQASNAASDLAASGSYRLEGEVQVFDSGRLTRTGHVTIDRDGDSVREEMTFTDYQETAVTTGGKLYLVRKPAVVLPFAWDVRNLDRLWQATVPSGAAVGQIRPTKAKLNDAPAFCFDMTMEKDSQGRMCFTSAPRLLASHEIKTRGPSPFFLFSDYQAFADRYYPATVRSMSGTRPSFEIRNITVKPMQFPADHFAPLEGAVGSPTCRDIRPPRLVHHVEPHYPALARMAHIQGTAVIEGVISVNGNLTELKSVSGDPVLLQETLETVRQWKYAPAMCPDGPVPTETELKVEFHL